jgi:MATE family multidrug resistance protein
MFEDSKKETKPTEGELQERLLEPEVPIVKKVETEIITPAIQNSIHSKGKEFPQSPRKSGFKTLLSNEVYDIEFTDKEGNLSLSKSNIFNMFKKIVKNSSPYVITVLSYFLLDTINLIFLGNMDTSLLSINAAQMGNVFMHIFGMLFVTGQSHAFDSLGSQAYGKKDMDLFYKIFNEAKIFSILIFLIFMLPICFTSQYILLFFGLDTQIAEQSSIYIRIGLISVFIDLFNIVHGKFLQILGFDILVMCINIIALVVHIISCICFIYTYNLGVVGAVISLAVSSGFTFLALAYFVFIYNPWYGSKSPYSNPSTYHFRWCINVDTDCLSSSKFYFYAKYAISSGLFHFIKEVSFDLIVFASYFIDQISLTSNTILYNYITLIFHILIGFSVPVTQSVGYYLGKLNFKKNELFIKGTIIIAALLALFISIFNFMFKYYISRLYVANLQVAENFAYIMNIYCILIFFDWGNHILNAILKGINRHADINILSNLFLLFIFVPLGLLLSFSFKLGYAGFWYSMFSYMILFTLIQVGYLQYINIEKESHTIIKELNKLVDEEDLFFK